MSLESRMGQAGVDSSGYLDQCYTKDESIGLLHKGIYGDHLCITWPVHTRTYEGTSACVHMLYAVLLYARGPEGHMIYVDIHSHHRNSSILIVM